MIGTAYDCTKTGKPYILFLEDVGENLEHLHRYLTVLKHLGILDHAAGLVFGEWTQMPDQYGVSYGTSRGGEFTSVPDMIGRLLLEDIDIPAAFDFPAGHGDLNYPLLMGEKVRLDVTEEDYTLQWIE